MRHMGTPGESTLQFVYERIAANPTRTLHSLPYYFVKIVDLASRLPFSTLAVKQVEFRSYRVWENGNDVSKLGCPVINNYPRRR